jgi:hypothetical protein
MSVKDKELELEIDDEDIDFLTEDNPLPGQKYGCVSFISPEKEIAQKNDFLAYNFYKYQMKMVKKIVDYKFRQLSKNNDLGKLIDVTDVEKLNKSLLADLDRLDLSNVVNRYLYEEVKDNKEGANTIEEEKADYSDFNEFQEKYLEEYENFKVSNDDRVQSEYDTAVDFKTNIRGVKLRGNFDTLKEARMRAKLLQKRDPSFHVWVAQVGFWVPWDADPDKAPSSEYQEQGLQELAKKKRENEEKREILQAQRREEDIKLAEIRNKKANAEQKKKLEADKENNENNTNNNDPDPKDVEMSQPTETLTANKIQELLNQRKQNETENDTSNSNSNKFDISQEMAQSGFGGMDPWLARKVDKQTQDEDNEDDDE